MKRRSFLLGLASALAITSLPIVAEVIETPLKEATLVKDKWHHVALTRDGNKVQCYLDGVEVSNISGTQTSVDEQGTVKVSIDNSVKFVIDTKLKQQKTWALESWVKSSSTSSEMNQVNLLNTV